MLYGLGNVPSFPGLFLFGIFIVTLITAEKTQTSMGTANKAQAENHLLHLRFNAFTRAFHVLNISHDQLREQLANTRFSMREALQMVREVLQTQHEAGNKGLSKQVGSELLAIYAYFCSVQVAAAYKIEPDNSICPEPLAEQGEIGVLDVTDPLIAKALQEGTLVSIKPESYTDNTSEEVGSNLLAVIPIKDFSGHLWGIVVVAEMHLIALQDENLNLMQLLGSYTGDLLSRAENILRAEKDAKAFTAEVNNCWQLAREFGIVSSLFCITFQDLSVSKDIANVTTGGIRNLDQAWITVNLKKQPVIFFLMPLTDENEYQLFRQRLDKDLTSHFEKSLEELGGELNYMAVRRNQRLSDLFFFIQTRKTKGTTSTNKRFSFGKTAGSN
jgi:hypothetical protein